MPRKTQRPNQPSRPATWLATVADAVPHTRHYVGAAVVILAIGLAAFIWRANSMTAGPIAITRTR